MKARRTDADLHMSQVLRVTISGWLHRACFAGQDLLPMHLCIWVCKVHMLELPWSYCKVLHLLELEDRALTGAETLGLTDRLCACARCIGPSG